MAKVDEKKITIEEVKKIKKEIENFDLIGNADISRNGESQRIKPKNENILNQDDYNGYQYLYKIRNKSDKKYLYCYNRNISKYCERLFAIGTAISFGIAISMVVLIPDSLGGYSLLNYVQFPFTLCGSVWLTWKETYKLGFTKNLRELKNDYPNIDVNIDNDTLEKELARYEEFSKGQKEEHLSRHQESIKEMTTEEKIEYFKEVLNENKRDMEKPKVKQKRMN